MKKPRTTGAAPKPVTRLSFVVDYAPNEENKRRCFWSVPKTGNYKEDCEAGCRIGAEALAYLRETGLAELLIWIVSDMVKRGEFGGVEVGFLGAVAMAAIVGVRSEANGSEGAI